MAPTIGQQYTRMYVHIHTDIHIVIRIRIHIHNILIHGLVSYHLMQGKRKYIFTYIKCEYSNFILFFIPLNNT